MLIFICSMSNFKWWIILLFIFRMSLLILLVQVTLNILM